MNFICRKQRGFQHRKARKIPSFFWQGKEKVNILKYNQNISPKTKSYFAGERLCQRLIKSRERAVSGASSSARNLTLLGAGNWKNTWIQAGKWDMFYYKQSSQQQAVIYRFKQAQTKEILWQTVTAVFRLQKDMPAVYSLLHPCCCICI